MERTKRIFISDIHIGAGKVWDTFKHKDHEKRLCSFLDWVKKQKDVKDLVLLGDIFDTWVWPHNRPPVTITNILNADINSNIIDSINAISDETDINVIYCNGNHDQEATEEDLRGFFPKMIYSGDEYESRPVYAVHGNCFDLFNSQYKQFEYPLGYFITRVITKDNGDSPSMFDVIQSSLDDIFEALFSGQTAPQSVFEAAMEAAGVNDNTEIVLLDGGTITCRDVKEKYKDLVNDCVDETDKKTAKRMAFANLDLDVFACDVLDSEDYKAIVMGHTHDSKVEKYDILKHVKGIYANTGYWAGRKSPTFIEISEKKQISVSLCSWWHGRRDSIKSERTKK